MRHSRNDLIALQLVERNWKIAHTLASSVEYGVGDGGSDAGRADLSDPARAHGRSRIG